MGRLGFFHGSERLVTVEKVLRNATTILHHSVSHSCFVTPRAVEFLSYYFTSHPFLPTGAVIVIDGFVVIVAISPS